MQGVYWNSLLGKAPADRNNGGKTPFRIRTFPDGRGRWESSDQDVFSPLRKV